MKKFQIWLSYILLGTIVSVFGLTLSFFKVPNIIIYFTIGIVSGLFISFKELRKKDIVRNENNDLDKTTSDDNKNEFIHMSLELAKSSQNMFVKTKHLYDISQNVFDVSKNAMDLMKEDKENILDINSQINSILDEADNINNDCINTKKTSEMNISVVNIGKNKIEGSFNNIRDLEDTNNKFINIVETLKNSSSAIYKIVEYIEGLSNKTNILSLNAGIEATRAGEAGKGFLVITSEIKKLADQSKQFSHNIKEFISEIEKNINDIKNMAELSKEKIDITNISFTEVKESLDAIVDKSNELDKNINNILISSRNIKDSTNVTLDKSSDLKNSYENTLELMNDNISSINNQWDVVENFNGITNSITQLSDLFLSQIIDEKIENKLNEIGIEIMNYKGNKTPENLKELCKKLKIGNIFYANKKGIFEYGTVKEALGLNIFELDKRFIEFVRSTEEVRQYPLSRRLDTGEVCKFMAVKRLDKEGVISVEISIEGLLNI